MSAPAAVRRTGAARTRELVRASAVTQSRVQTHATLVLVGCVQPLAFFLVVHLVDPTGTRLDASRSLLGCGLLALWGCAVWQAGLILREEMWQGTLASIVVRPAPLGVVLAGKALGTTLRASALIVVTVAVLSWVTRTSLAPASPVLFAVVVVAAVIGSFVLGLLLSCVFLLTTATFRVAEALLYPVFILGGLLVPVELLPAVVRPLADGISLHWAAELLVDASTTGTTDARDWGFFLLLTSLYGLAARWAFRRVVDRSRRLGTLELI